MDASVRAEQSGREILERFWQAAESGDTESMMSLVREDIVMFWPQSGERFVGKENVAGAMGETEVKPTMEGEPEVIGNGDVWTAHTRLRYGDDLYHYVGVFQLADGKIAQTREYFAPPFPPNESRAQYAEPM